MIMRRVANQEVHPVMKAIICPLVVPPMAEPKKAVRMELNTWERGERTQDEVSMGVAVEFDIGEGFSAGLDLGCCYPLSEKNIASDSECAQVISLILLGVSKATGSAENNTSTDPDAPLSFPWILAMMSMDLLHLSPHFLP